MCKKGVDLLLIPLFRIVIQYKIIGYDLLFVRINPINSQLDAISAYEFVQRKGTLNVILWVIAIAGLVLGIVNYIFGFLAAGTSILVLCAVCLLAIFLNRKGYFNASAVIVSSLLLIVIVFDIVDAGGLGNDLGFIAFTPAIVVFSLLMGKRWRILFIMLSILSIYIIGEMDIRQIIDGPIKTDWGDVATAFVLLLCTAILLWLILDNAEKNVQKIKSENENLQVSYDLTLEGLAQTLELRDQDTEHHSRRVVDLSVKLAKALGLKEEEFLIIYHGALLHDIGKMGVPDAILLKQGPLTEDEWVEMRKHPEHAQTILANIPFLQSCISIPVSHHERWDGTGYPCRLKGEEIPLYARIFAIIDQWEALTSDRIYRKAWPREKVLAYIQDNSGKIYDPQIVPVFLNLVETLETESSDALAQKDDKSIKTLSMPQKMNWFDTLRKKSASNLVQTSFLKFWGSLEYTYPFDEYQRKKILNGILWIICAASFGLGWVNLTTDAGVQNALIEFILSVFCLLAIFLNNRGYFIAGAIGISIGMLFAATFSMFSWTGLHAIGIAAFPTILVVCSLFFGKRGLVVLTLLSGLIIGAAGFLEINQLFIPIQAKTDWIDVFILETLVLCVSILLWVIRGQAEKNIRGIKTKEIELIQSYELTLEGFAKALELRGRDPQGHNRRVVDLSARLAQKMGIQGADLEIIRRGALLHDIGTLSIPDKIILKPGPLNAAEMAEMHKHPERARELLARIPYLRSSIDIPYCQHECWDGTGYPRGLKGEEIPLYARLFTLVDHWAELTSDRPFRPAWQRQKVLEYIQEHSGQIYDPQIVPLFLNLLKDNNYEGCV
jgi:putative nucleotidyltransferase with HDIG domain